MTKRERFETWYIQNHHDGDIHPNQQLLEWNEKGEFYFATSVNDLWEAWKAARQKWISVADRLPDIGVSVMAGAYKGSEFYWHFYERYEEDGFWMWSRHESDLGSDCEADDYTITHWQPLPEPPKEQT